MCGSGVRIDTQKITVTVLPMALDITDRAPVASFVAAAGNLTTITAALRSEAKTIKISAGSPWAFVLLDQYIEMFSLNSFNHFRTVCTLERRKH